MKTNFLFLLFFINLFYGQDKKLYTNPNTANYNLSNGDINLIIPNNFTKKEFKDEIFDNFNPLFKTLNLPIPNDLFLLQKSKYDVLFFMFTKGNSDYSLGKNENLSKDQIDLIFSNLNSKITKGNLENIKINGLNLIRHSYTANSLRITMYYMYDYNNILFFMSAAKGDLDNSLIIEQKILESFKRKQIITNKDSYEFFNLTINLDKNTEFLYGKESINKMPNLFNEIDKIAESAGISKYINSNLLANSANIYSKNNGSLMITANEIDLSINNSELLKNSEEIENAKKIVDDLVDKNVPKNIDIIKSNKAFKYESKNGICYIIKEVVAKKTNMINSNVYFDTSMFIELFHKDKMFTIVCSYKDTNEKKFIYEVINNIEIK